MIKKLAPLVVLLLIHLFFLVNLQFTAWPEMLSYPYLANNGFKLYSDFIHPYPPALTFLLAFIFNLFSYELTTLKVFTWSLIIINDVLIYLLVAKLTKQKLQALLAVLLYVCTQPFLEGNMLWFDTALVTPVLLGLFYLVKKNSNKDLVLSGLFFALAVYIKQTAALLVIVAIGYLVFKGNRVKNVAVFLFPSFVLGVIFLAYLLSTSQFQEFLNWNLIYPFTYWSDYPNYVQMNLSKYQTVVLATLLFPLVLAIFKNAKKLAHEVKLTISLFLVSLIMVYPRFSFFHFQLALALIVILLAAVSANFKHRYYLYSLYFLAILVLVVRVGVVKYWGQEARFWSRTDIELAQTISAKSLDKTIYLLGQPSGLYVYANLLPPKPWTDNFGWYLEIPGVQERIIAEWTRQPANYIYWQQPQSGNWYDLGTYQPKQITDWIKTNYELTGKLDDNIDIWQKK